MTIDANTKISELLRFDRDLVIKTLISLNSKFAKLRNPVLRQLLVKRVSISDACKISNTPLSDFLHSMEQIGFQVIRGAAADNALPLNTAFIEQEDYLELDVRPILAKDKDPLKEILAAINSLGPGQGLKLINTFEPLPLIHLLTAKGFAHRVVFEKPDLVITFFNQADTGTGTIDVPANPESFVDDALFDRVLAGFRPEQVSYLDVRALEMPKPMLAILEHTPGLTKGEALFVYHKKIPVYLLPELEKQGLSYLFKNIAPGNVHLLIFLK
ncbi:DUF2249 domain-containing protein [Mucilaginibacter sp.]|uniref:DUF2249 domain-containing protein n=1 Tax=Mucilaginibacter sp. TaxID=1882438 RepID=UPI003565632A